MKNLALVLMLLFSAFSYAQETTHDLGNFRQIKVYNGLKVSLEKGNKNRAVVTGESREEVKFQINKGILKIKLSLDNIWDDENNTRIKLYYRDLEKVDALQNSTVKLEDKIKQDSFGVEVQEGSEIYGEVNVDYFTAKCLTGGEIEVEGKADQQEVTIRAGGQYYAKNLRSENIEISISAGGVADIYATAEVKAKVRAGGTVNVYGNPELIDKNTLLGGEVNRKN